MRYLINDRVSLRAPEPEDIPLVSLWENDSSQWGDGCALAPYSRYAIRNYIEESLRQDIYQSRQLRLMIVDNATGQSCGMIDLFDFEPLHRRASVGVYVAPKCRGRGYAHEALRLLSDYAFGFLHMHQLCAQVAEGNTSSLRLFESCGFERCALLRDWILRDNRYEAVIALQKISD
ncbi:MAG: GNAT family N-acetyltransferase [Coprobacter sp.]|nr:GNAT family N-acetyltransferase [Coprobacter sp.]